MKKQVDTVINGPGKQQHRKETISVFIETLTDIHRVKEHMLTYLPNLAGKVITRSLRFAVLNAYLDLKAQLLRLDMAIAILKQESNVQFIKESELNMEQYIRSALLKAESYKTDMALLSHLLMVEGMQITSFTLLKKMAQTFRNRVIVNLIESNLQDTFKNKASLESIMNNYLKL